MQGHRTKATSYKLKNETNNNKSFLNMEKIGNCTCKRAYHTLEIIKPEQTMPQHKLLDCKEK